MPVPYVKKMAKKHKTSVSRAEGLWNDAKKSAEKQGHGDNYSYITGIFKKMIGESYSGSFKAFLSENDLEVTTSPPDSTGDELDVDVNHEANGESLDLENDEQFLNLPPEEQIRLMVYARNMSPTEVQEELARTIERVASEQPFEDDLEGDQEDLTGDELNGLDDMEDGSVETENGDEYEIADPAIAMPNPERRVGESFLSHLLKQ